ncbi:RHS repeat-associated core domain-containing protein [Clostridium frigidicarnis]|uniref:RHS repeat-associated core domain-containing protein n=1 Tax=Clostridium frigidicarnis TaxID=84698 RepID=A0A1I0VU81_9CLOT|nr:RHS repeat-associated core domain-containing protein [Clostridium frigidicarnis]SFA79965.1 RHS repeat-associated core domain-containing protein [Clostridium frigidicarnis]
MGQVVTQNTYDPKGNIKTSIDGENNKVEYTHNLLGKIKEIITPSSKKENKVAQSYKYDGRGNITGIIDGNGNETSYVLDDWGRITKIVTPEGGQEAYTYDYAGNITSTTDANGGTIEYFYNSLGQVCEIKDQEGHSEYFYYDNEGNVTKTIDRNGNQVEKSYNLDRNIVSTRAYNKDKENAITERFTYNEDGTLKSAYSKNMQYEYSYTKEGMLESKSACGKQLLSYTYDKNNNIRSIKDITGKSSIYSYDDENRVKVIKDNNENTLATYDYYNNDNIKSITVGNGLKTDYTYDGDGNVKSLVTVSSNGEVLVDYNYAYDLNGNRLEKLSSKHKTYYTYDSMNRLKESSYDGRQESFTYDKVGNRLSKTTNNITEKYVYNVKNQLKELQGKENTTYFTYDKQGNTIKEESNLGNNIFEYNTLNQQVKAITKEGNTLVNRYDAEGLRYEIEENEKLSRFIFNKNGDILVELDSDDNVISRFSRGYEVVAADIVDSSEEFNSAIESKFNRYFYTVDEQGSTIFITDKNQQIKNEYYYDAFGNVLDGKEEVHNRITYVGQQFDGITGKYYLRARFYNPVIGRFTQEDTYRGDGLNLYAYCGNNPICYYDPSGYMSCETKTQSIKKSRLEELKENYKKKYGEEFTAEKLHQNINERNGIKFLPRAENSPIKQGGYKINDIDKYKKNSPGKNRANGYSHKYIDGLIESHHPIQNEWAEQWAKKNNISGYKKRNAPGILLKSISGESHAKLSSSQRARRRKDGFNTSIVYEFNTGYKELIESGVNSKYAKKAIREAYRYFDSLGGF